MLKVYPDFAFYTSTQVVLFFANVVVTTLSFSWGADILLRILQKQVPLGRRLLFNVASALGLQISVAYGVALFNGLLTRSAHLLDSGIFLNITSIILPSSYFVLYWMCMRVLRLTKYQSMRFSKLLYSYFVFSQMLLRIGGTFVFPSLEDPRGWNYMRDILAITCGTLVMYMPYRLLVSFIRRHKLHMDFPDNLVIPNARSELVKNFGVSCMVYGAVMLCLYLPTGTGYEYVYMSAFLLCYLALSMMLSHIRIEQTRIGNKDAHIAMLIGSIEEFRGVKHDFHNILQTYSGYLITEDYDGLKQYHQKMVNTMVTSEAGMEIGVRMQEYPAFFSLIGAKIEAARQRRVSFRVSLPYIISQMDMDPLDFCRVMGSLMDNAIDGAAETASRRVEMFCQLKPSGNRVLILSNDVAAPVDTEMIFQPGYTTKPGHMGQGLAQVREILQRYGNCTLNISNYKSYFTVYFEIWSVTAMECAS